MPPSGIVSRGVTRAFSDGVSAGALEGCACAVGPYAPAAASAAAILVRRGEYVRSMMSSSRGQRCTDRIQTAGLVVAGGASKRDREPVPAVDGHNRQRQRD